MTDGAEALVRERHGHVLVLRLNRPESRNALDAPLLEALGGAIVAAEADSDVRAVVLTGTGDRAFSAGMDLRAFADGESMTAIAPEALAAYYRLLDGEVTVPLVGAANATAVAGGLELLLGCDLIVASAAAEFGLPEVRRGLFPGGGGTAISQRIPLGVALEMAMTGHYITAERAYAIGLVNAVEPPDEVLPSAIELAQRIAANAPLGVAACKELVRLAATGEPAMRGAAGPLARRRVRERRRQRGCHRVRGATRPGLAREMTAPVRRGA